MRLLRRAAPSPQKQQQQQVLGTPLHTREPQHHVAGRGNNSRDELEGWRVLLDSTMVRRDIAAAGPVFTSAAAAYEAVGLRWGEWWRRQQDAVGDSMAVGSGVSGSGVSGSDGSGSDRGSNSSGGRPPPWSIDGSSLSLAPLSTPRPTLPPLGAEVVAVRLSQDQSRLAYLVPVLRGVDQYCCIVRDIASGGW